MLAEQTFGLLAQVSEPQAAVPVDRSVIGDVAVHSQHGSFQGSPRLVVLAEPMVGHCREEPVTRGVGPLDLEGLAKMIQGGIKVASSVESCAKSRDVYIAVPIGRHHLGGRQQLPLIRNRIGCQHTCSDGPSCNNWVRVPYRAVHQPLAGGLVLVDIAKFKPKHGIVLQCLLVIRSHFDRSGIVTNSPCPVTLLGACRATARPIMPSVRIRLDKSIQMPCRREPLLVPSTIVSFVLMPRDSFPGRRGEFLGMPESQYLPGFEQVRHSHRNKAVRGLEAIAGKDLRDELEIFARTCVGGH